MKFKLIAAMLLFAFSLSSGFSQENENPEDEYTRVIKGRADKIVDEMSFEDKELKFQIRDLIMDHYRFLNDADESRNADVAEIREKYADNKEIRNMKIDLRKAEQEMAVRDHHFAFVSELNVLLPRQQVDQVKDGLTYNVCPNTYQAFQDMIPMLTEEEKEQILIWLTEAREHAIDGGSSREKHNWFGKYKGKINNYLSDRGYDLKKLSDQWEEKLRQKGEQL